MFSAKMTVRDIDRGFKRIKKAVKDQNGAELTVGLFGAKTNPNDKSPKLSIAQIGAVHEFGTRDGKIPQRSFMRSTFDKNNKKYLKLASRLERSVIAGRISIKRMFNEIAIVMQSDIKLKITRGPFRELKPATLKARRSRVKSGMSGSKPLIDTGIMRDAIIFETKIKGRKKRSGASS